MPIPAALVHSYGCCASESSRPKGGYLHGKERVVCQYHRLRRASLHGVPLRVLSARIYSGLTSGLIGKLKRPARTSTTSTPRLATLLHIHNITIYRFFLGDEPPCAASEAIRDLHIPSRTNATRLATPPRDPPTRPYQQEARPGRTGSPTSTSCSRQTCPSRLRAQVRTSSSGGAGRRYISPSLRLMQRILVQITIKDLELTTNRPCSIPATRDQEVIITV